MNNNGPKLPTPTSSSEIMDLLSASGTLSLDSTAPTTDSFDGESNTLADRYSEDIEKQPDNRVEKNQLYNMLYSTINQFDIKQRKFLKMKGIEL